LIPGLWKIDGYGKVAQTIQAEFDAVPGENYFEFPYDWRRDNRVHARRLARQSHQWLSAWRERSGNQEARLILVGHSMGGLIARYFLELHEGWRDTRFLITFGTPYRGSLNALGFLSNGVKERLGPVTLLNFTNAVRSFTSAYQLLPVYPCIDRGDGNLARVTEVGEIRGIDRAKSEAALAFHTDIRQAVDEHLNDTEYVERGYRTKPITGLFQPTHQSANQTAEGVELLLSIGGRDEGGDGTVPSISATPIELSNKDTEFYIRERHSSLQNADGTLDQVMGLLRRQLIDQRQAFAPGAGIRLDLEDAYLVGEPVTIEATPETEPEQLEATVQRVEAEDATHATLASASDGVHRLTLPALSEGVYRVTVRGSQPESAVTDIFAVVEEGRDAFS
jgi:pimeloyl-ACP methyl ester carboxylesterase